MTLPADATTAAAQRQHYGLTFAVLALGAGTFAILQSLVAPALPEIQRDLHTSTTAVAWILTAYLLSASVLTPIVGRLGDMFGKERTLVVSLAVLAAGTLLAALATNIDGDDRRRASSRARRRDLPARVRDHPRRVPARARRAAASR